ncbi:MAG: cbb3-type cytochrome c oxidase subunit I, partial [Gemmatimonadota bacterium]|nr:cbb3-type cytochrome c oxidase subunit I [Gemmatimonadota bacterium]
GFSANVFSIIIFGFIGGITGVTIGTEQINIIVHNTLRVPGHFHATVVGGTALAFMGATYYLIPLVFRKKVAFWPLAKIQPYIFTIGMVLFTLFMTFAGSFGVPRRHWDITFSQAPFDVQMNPAVDVVLAIMALGGLLAATGALIFIAIAVVSVFFGQPVGTIQRGVAVAGIPQGLTNPPLHAADVNARNEKLHAEAKGIGGATPGTMVLVFVFLAAFILYFFTNWKMLSFVWKVG